jgi:hypothetical protein
MFLFGYVGKVGNYTQMFYEIDFGILWDKIILIVYIIISINVYMYICNVFVL